MIPQVEKLKKMAFISMISAFYVALTSFSACFGVAYTGIQLRLSEVLTVLPIFTSSQRFSWQMFLPLFATVGIGQFIVCYILGVPLIIILNKLKLFSNS